MWARTASVQGSYDWLARQFGARAHVEQNWALESGLYDLDLRPLASVIDATGVTWPDALPVLRPGSVAGEVSRTAAEASGLREGDDDRRRRRGPRALGLRRGARQGRRRPDQAGGAGDILAVSMKVFLDRRLYLDAHPIPGSWLPNGCMATSGSVLRWEQALFAGVSLDELDAEARASAPGALLSLPYFLGEKTPLHDPDLRGVIAGLHLASTRGDLHRSFLEGIAYGFRAHVDVFAEGGLVLGDVRVTNGGSRSRLWREILADVLQRDLISIINHPGASYGAAVIAGIGTGVVHDWSYVAGALEAGEVISPDPAHVALYEERFQQFLQLGESTAVISHSLSRSTP